MDGEPTAAAGNIPPRATAAPTRVAKRRPASRRLLLGVIPFLDRRLLLWIGGSQVGLVGIQLHLVDLGDPEALADADVGSVVGFPVGDAILLGQVTQSPGEGVELAPRLHIGRRVVANLVPILVFGSARRRRRRRGRRGRALRTALRRVRERAGRADREDQQQHWRGEAPPRTRGHHGRAPCSWSGAIINLDSDALGRAGMLRRAATAATRYRSTRSDGEPELSRHIEYHAIR